MISKKKLAIIVIISIALTAAISLTVGNLIYFQFGSRVLIPKDDADSLMEVYQKYNEFEMLFDYTEDNFLYDYTEEQMLTGALEGMLASLDDPYTEYLTKEEFDSLMQETSGSYEGIGVYITPSDDNKILVVSPIEDTPAEKAGLKTGDKIVQINGVDYTAEEMDAAISVMKGMPNTSVNITILREDDDGTQETINLDIMRETIKLQTVKSEMMGNNVGYIRITTFDRLTAGDFKTQYDALESEGMTSLIIDLRSNPGGLIDSTVEITDMLLGEGLITYTETKSGYRTEYKSDKDKIEIPYVLLVNEGSASASEIMAGAVKDTGSGLIIGTQTFGKGIVQGIQAFGTSGAGVKMTHSEYFTPNGINIHGIGIEPDLVFELNPDAEGYGPEYLDTDNQLQEAIIIISE